jgi:hypothetical protein
MTRVARALWLGRGCFGREGVRAYWFVLLTVGDGRRHCGELMVEGEDALLRVNTLVQS